MIPSADDDFVTETERFATAHEFSVKFSRWRVAGPNLNGTVRLGLCQLFFSFCHEVIRNLCSRQFVVGLSRCDIVHEKGRVVHAYLSYEVTTEVGGTCEIWVTV